jgi:hypothetical protein
MTDERYEGDYDQVEVYMSIAFYRRNNRDRRRRHLLVEDLP